MQTAQHSHHCCKRTPSRGRVSYELALCVFSFFLLFTLVQRGWILDLDWQIAILGAERDGDVRRRRG